MKGKKDTILFFICGDKQIASSRIRVLQFLPYLEKQDIKTYAIVANPYLLKMSHNPIVRVLQHILIQAILVNLFYKTIFYKTIFLQKVFPPIHIIWFLKKLGKNIIYDFDDSIYLTPDNKARKIKKVRRLHFILKNASFVIVASELNLDYAKRFNAKVFIVSGPVECNRYSPTPKNTNFPKVVIGWIGSSSTSKYLVVAEEAILKLHSKYKDKIEFLFIGTNINYNLKHIVCTQEWNYNTELELLSRFDIGIMPLTNDTWSEGKGGYKLLQYMALGIPSVASPIGINPRIVEHQKTGYLANNSVEWFNYLEDLIQNPEKRIEFGKTARLKALSNYSYENYSRILLENIFLLHK